MENSNNTTTSHWQKSNKVLWKNSNNQKTSIAKNLPQESKWTANLNAQTGKLIILPKICVTLQIKHYTASDQLTTQKQGSEKKKNNCQQESFMKKRKKKQAKKAKTKKKSFFKMQVKKW